LALSESFIRSDEVEEASSRGIRQDRQPFSTNTISPQVRYDLTQRTVLNGAYTNTIVWNENGGGGNGEPVTGDQEGMTGDSISHAFSTGLRHLFSRNLIGGGNYTFTMVDSEEEGDTHNHDIFADLTYVISPRTTTSLGAFGTIVDRQNGASGAGTGGISEDDANIYGISLGVRRQLTPFLAAFVSVGPTIVSREDRPTRVFANWQASIDGSLPLTRRSSLSFSTQQTIDDTAGDIDDVGLVLNQSATVTLNYAIARNLFSSLFGTYTRTTLLEDVGDTTSLQDREFSLWNAGLRFSYALSPVWSLGLNYLYQHRDSDVPSDATVDGNRIGGSFDENRVTFSISAAFPL
jgi:hypothetical protein